VQLNRFWSSVWSVLVYLVSIAMLQWVFNVLATGFGLLPRLVTNFTLPLVTIAIPIIGTVLYTDWRWGWRSDYFGLKPKPASLGMGALGLVAGIGGAYLVKAVSLLLAGQSLSGVVGAVTIPGPTLILTLLTFFASEVVFRGAVISRYQSDLAGTELLLAAALTPLGWILAEQLIAALVLPVQGLPNLRATWDAPLVIFLAVLYLKADSLWLSAGIRIGVMAGLLWLVQGWDSQAAFLVFGLAALVMLLFWWFNQKRMPRRVQPRSTGRGRGRVYQGPWNGPH
jgi:hypothetical protein